MIPLLQPLQWLVQVIFHPIVLIMKASPTMDVGSLGGGLATFTGPNCGLKMISVLQIQEIVGWQIHMGSDICAQKSDSWLPPVSGIN
jgi:hypothetical protein